MTLIQRKGRLLSDGTRTPARALRRVTIYLPDELGRWLDAHSAATERDKSSVVTEALETHRTLVRQGRRR